MLVAEVERESRGFYSGAGEVGPATSAPMTRRAAARSSSLGTSARIGEVALPKHLGVKTLFLNV